MIHKAALQGKLVPKLYGVGHTFGMAFIAMEDGGTALDEQDLQKEDVKLAVRQQLTMLHQAGITHSDLAARNIVQQDNKLMFVDLAHANYADSRLMSDDNIDFDIMCNPQLC